MIFTSYRRKNLAELSPYKEGMDMTNISVSSEDFENGSPKTGDMIARNPENLKDMWLVAKKYFIENFELTN